MSKSYGNIHEYLDAILDDDATNAEIITAKKEYWKQYNTRLKQDRKVLKKTISLTISHRLWQQLAIKADQAELNPYLFVKLLLKNSVEQDAQNVQTLQVKQLLQENVELLTEMLEGGFSDSQMLLKRLERIEFLLAS